MGGLGALRMSFKYPTRFRAVVAQEPGLEPTIEWIESYPRYRFWQPPDLYEEAFGKPVDPAFWQANNPAAIARSNSAALKQSGLAIYLEVGDEDIFLLNEGVEFLHRVLLDNGIRHEYRLVYGANHVGRTLPARTIEALKFLSRLMDSAQPDPAVERFRRQIFGGMQK